MNKLNQQASNGITLIALVITIIILLILAGVAISMTINSDGLFGKAKEAAEGWNTSVQQEEIEISDLMGIANNIGGNIGGNDNGDEPETDASGANAPVVPTGVKVEYVTWKENSNVTGQYDEVLSTTKPENWHNYNEKKWANIKTTSSTANTDGTYNSAYWVWIPRYAYQVPAKPTGSSDLNVPTFQIAFLKGVTNTPVDSTVLNGKTIKTDTSAGVSVGDWVVHPAFWWDENGDGVEDNGEQLSGIWVAKYEASSNAPSTVAYGGGDTATTYQVTVLPNVPSWRNIQLTNMFQVCQGMIASKGALEGNTTTDPHVMKNVEWGAVTYLTQSKYGKNGQVWNNPYYQQVTGNDIIITGKVASAANSADALNTTACDSYNVGNGPQGSTTGNVYGVYDMAGGSYEYVAAYVNNSVAQSSTNITKLREAGLKYKDVYVPGGTENTTDNFNANTKKYGDAMYETTPNYGTNFTGTTWQGDTAAYAYQGAPVFFRGGCCIESEGTRARNIYVWNYAGS